MSKTIAVAGKGGTGKTTVASLIVMALKEERAGKILAIDADPNSNLGELLGFKSVSTIVDIVDDISKNPEQIPIGISKDRFIDLKIQESVDEGDGFDLLTMGKPEGPGCYCFANNMLRELIKKLMNSYDYVVIDNEAGMEHLSRRLVHNVDSLFMVAENTVISMRAVSRISKLVNDLGIKVKEKNLIINKVRPGKAAADFGTEQIQFNLKEELPLNEEIEDASIKNISVFNLTKENIVFNKIKGLLKTHVKQ